MMPFNALANRADPDQAALVRAAWSGSTLFAFGHMIRYDPSLVNLTNNFFALVVPKFIYVIIHSGWSLAWIFIKERVKIFVVVLIGSVSMRHFEWVSTKYIFNEIEEN